MGGRLRSSADVGLDAANLNFAFDAVVHDGEVSPA
jgi:hypothetical protein